MYLISKNQNLYQYLDKHRKHNFLKVSKKIVMILVMILSLTSCKENNKNQVTSDDLSIQSQEIKTEPIVKKETANNNNLCQINGEDWAYTKASGVISTHARTKKRTALITFKKKLEKGSESIQLTYDAISFELIEVSLILKFPKKDGSQFACYYDLKPDTKKRSPESEISGTIDISDPTVASGIAEIKNLNIKYEKEILKSAEDAVVSITDLRFSNIGYSDVDKLAKAFKK